MQWQTPGGEIVANEKRLIDAGALKNAIYTIADVTDNERIFIDVIINEIDNASPLDAVEVVHGHWKPVYDYDDGEIDHIAENCSVCKGHVGWFKGRSFNYCPNCGAKMDGDTNE